MIAVRSTNNVDDDQFLLKSYGACDVNGTIFNDSPAALMRSGTSLAMYPSVAA